MRRLLRWTFHTLAAAAAAASLLLCVATATLWLRSYWVADRFVAKRRAAATGGPGSSPRHCEFFVTSQLRGQFEGWVGWSERPEVGPTPPWEFEITHPQVIAVMPDQQQQQQQQQHHHHHHHHHQQQQQQQQQPTPRP